MRTYLRGKITLLFMMLGMLLAVPTVALAADLLTEAELSSAVSAPTDVATNATTNFDIKVWARGNLNNPSATGDAVITKAYTMGAGGITANTGTGSTTTVKFKTSFNYGTDGQTCPAATDVPTQPAGVTGRGCATDPFVVPATLTVGNLAAGTNGTLTVEAVGTQALNNTTPLTCTTSDNAIIDPNNVADTTDCTKDQGFVEVVNPDQVAPTSTASATVPDGDDAGTDPDPYTGGTSWTNKDVTVSLNATDNAGGSGVKELTYSATGADPISPAVTKAAANLPTSFTIDAEGTTTISYFAKDNNGNVETAKTFVVNIDKVKPVISATATVPDGDDAGTDPDPYTAGTWTNKDVTVNFSCTDALSGTDTNTVAGDTKNATGADQSVTNTGTCTDKAGNTADSKTFDNIDIDKTNPTISSSADRLNADNTVAGTYTAGTWTNKSVRVSFSCNDALSGVNTTASDIAGNTLTTEGEDQSVSSTGSCVDQAGNTASGASFSNIDIDKTAPTNIQFSGTSLTNNQTYEFGSVPAGPTGCSANGDISGLKSPCSTDAATTYKTTVGTHTITATAEDNAGNIGHATLVYTVDAWDATGFYSPVGTDNSKFLPAPGTLPTVNNSGEWNTVKGGSTVPLKFNVKAGSTEKTSTDDIQYLKAQQMNCNSTTGGTVGDPVDFTTTEQTSLRYSGTPGVDGQFIQNWKSPKVGGETCYRTAVTLDDGSSIYAFFKLLK